MKLSAYELEALVRNIIDTVMEFAYPAGEFNESNDVLIVDDNARDAVCKLIEAALK